MAGVPAGSGEGRPIPQPRPVVLDTGRCGGESGGPSTPVQLGCSPQNKVSGCSSLAGSATLYFRLKPKLLRAFSLVGAVNKPYTFKEILCFLKAYLFKYNLIDPNNSRLVNCRNTELGKAFERDSFEYDDVRKVLASNIYFHVSEPKLDCTKESVDPIPNIPNYQLGSEAAYSCQGNETGTNSRIKEEEEDTVENVEEEQEEYELVTESEEEEISCSDSEIDVKNCILIFDVDSGGVDSKEECFADESESEPSNFDTEEHSSEDEKDQWVCPICGSSENRPYMGCCLKCFNLRKNWYPDPPKRRRKRKPRPNKSKIGRSTTKMKGNATREEEQEQPLLSVEDSCPSLERGLSSTFTVSISTMSMASTSTAFSSQDSRFGSQVLSSFEYSSGAKRVLLSDPEEKEEQEEEEEEEPVRGRKRRKISNASEKVATCKGDESEERNCMSVASTSSSNFKRGSLISLQESGRTRASASVLDSDSEQKVEGLCYLCCVRPKNAALTHGRISHVAFCYPCAEKLHNTKRAKCPICRRKIHMISKIIFV